MNLFQYFQKNVVIQDCNGVIWHGFVTVLAPGGISHSGPGENRQLWPDENSQS